LTLLILLLILLKSSRWRSRGAATRRGADGQAHGAWQEDGGDVIDRRRWIDVVFVVNSRRWRLIAIVRDKVAIVVSVVLVGGEPFGRRAQCVHFKGHAVFVHAQVIVVFGSANSNRVVVVVVVDREDR
jgi:hypothetical protein